MVAAEALRSPQRVEAPVKKVMPLSFVPEPQKRGFPSSELTSVAGHELNHALVALAHGVSIISLSVVREGNSLGRTILGGIVSMETAKIIAAGGGVETHDGCAEGYGSDRYKVDVLHYFHGGYSWESARSQAASILSGYSNDVRRRAAEIVAYLGEVSGPLVYEILLRAEAEISEEKDAKGQSGIQALFMPQIKSEGYTIIDTLPNNMSKITYVVVGKKDKEEYLCGVCHGVNGHSEECSNAKPFPREGTIFPVRELAVR